MPVSLWPHGLQPTRLPCPSLSRSLLKLMSIESVMPSKHLILSPPPPALSLSQHQVLFQWVVSSHQVAKNWSFSFSPSSECLERFQWTEVVNMFFFFKENISGIFHLRKDFFFNWALILYISVSSFSKKLDIVTTFYSLVYFVLLCM